MIDPILLLAMSVQTNPGVYALLLGSGVSRSAQIPTGWEIVIDLIRKLALLWDEDCEPNPEAWFRDTFGEDADYSKLLDAIAKCPSERQQLLRSYFEPSEDEREQGLKQPTAAHKAIAKLASGGYCRVILTTNFDKLTERALEAEGVSPTVISTPEAIEGALPLVHQTCCVIKVHGDYLDTRIKNTPEELAAYDDTLNRLLDQVFDEFGLVVCGWSGQWDAALRAALERCRTRRFSLFWAARGEPGEEAKKLVALRGGETIQIDDADSFFHRLSELVFGLEDSKQQIPASIEAAVALENRYLADPIHSIRLRDLVADEVEQTYHRIGEHGRQAFRPPASKQGFEAAFGGYRQLCERLLALLIHGCALGGPEHVDIWISAIDRIACPPEPHSGAVLAEGVWHYPVALLFYAAGIAGQCCRRTDALVSLLTQTKMRSRSGQIKPLVTGVRWSRITQFLKDTETHSSQHTPLSERMFSALREPLRRYLPDDDQYDENFDRFEYLLALVYADFGAQAEGESWFWCPLGRFAWKRRSRRCPGADLVRDEVSHNGEESLLLQHGMFGGSLERLEKATADVDEFVGGLSWH